MKLFRKRESYATQANRHIAEGNTPAAWKDIIAGLDDYQKQLLTAINGFPTADTALIVTVLRNYADALEKLDPNCIPLIKEIREKLKAPQIEGTNKMQKTRRR